MIDFKFKRIIDISQPVGSTSACFPGDVPFSKQVTLTWKDSKVINLTALTMSPHVGTHIDAPGHIKGDMEDASELAAGLPLEEFFGPVTVCDLAPFCREITWQDVRSILSDLDKLPRRILFRTQTEIRYDVFENEYSCFTPELIDVLAEKGVRLMGIDTPSVDHVNSKTLDAHHALDDRKMFWMENLDLTAVKPGEYFLCALPLKFTELEASPVRAVLLE